ncbi:MAG: hypothetical protein ABEH40_05415 [Haloferacaceae archaeon]
MEFTLGRTVALFLGLVVIAVGGLLGAGVMGTRTVLMMVAPSVLGYGAVCVALGVKHGEHRARTGG